MLEMFIAKYMINCARCPALVFSLRFIGISILYLHYLQTESRQSLINQEFNLITNEEVHYTVSENGLI